MSGRLIVVGAGFHAHAADGATNAGSDALRPRTRTRPRPRSRGVCDRPGCLCDDLVRGQAQLLLHVEGAGREEDVDPRARRVPRVRPRPRRCPRAVARHNEATVARRATRDRPHPLEIARRGGREACLDHVHAEPLELLADLRPSRPAAGRFPAPARRPEASCRKLGSCESSYIPPVKGTAEGGPVASTVGVRLRRVSRSPLEGENRKDDHDRPGPDWSGSAESSKSCSSSSLSAVLLKSLRLSTRSSAKTSEAIRPTRFSMLWTWPARTSA